MTPAIPAYDFADLLLADSELDSEIALADVTSGISLSNRHYLSFSQSPHAMALTLIVGEDGAALHLPIENVVMVGSQEPMGLVLTWGIIASMQYTQSNRNWPNPMFVSPAMGDHLMGGSIRKVRSIPEHAVSFFGASTGPQPAVIWAEHLNLVPVPINSRDTNTHYFQYNEGWL
jgi:hypothetical protein